MASASLIAAAFRDRFGTDAAVIASAPGRVNLIGEHTDYNEGLVLPMAIESRAFVAISLRTDGRSRVESMQQGLTEGWDEIPRGMLTGFGDLSDDVGTSASPTCLLRLPSDVAADVLIDSDVTVGAGLSSSAAVEMAMARALCALAERPWIPLEMARLAQQVEHRQAGVRSGLMDQLISVAAHEGMAMLLDCRSFDARPIRIPDTAAIVVMDTGARRTLGATDYNARRASCEEAARELGVASLRDVSGATLERGKHRLSPTQYRRARHVVTENERVVGFAQALESGDFPAAGALLDASHASLRDDYEVSSRQLDIVCDLARGHEACLGARLTGAGFGGCAIALVRADATADFIAAVQPRYEAATYLKSRFFRALPSAGARIDARTGRRAGQAAG